MCFDLFGEQNENNYDPDKAEKDVLLDGMGEEDDEDVDGAEVEFVDVITVLDEDDGLQFHLFKHQCSCHLLNLTSTVDAEKAN